MQTEPIGFKGTNGKWEAEYDNDEFGVWFTVNGALMRISYNDQERLGEIRANLTLMAASKQMAIRLQSNHDFMLALYQTIGDERFDKEVALQMLRGEMTKILDTLGEAGLSR